MRKQAFLTLMAEITGKFLYRSPEGTALAGVCGVRFDQQTFTLTRASDAAICFDLGDVDAVVARDWEVRVTLYTGATLVLSGLAKAYDNFVHDLGDAYRARSVQCLLLEDLEEIERFQGHYELVGAQTGEAEFRLYQSNLAVLAMDSRSFQWRLADIDSVEFNPTVYQVVLHSGQQRLTVSHLAKRTEEFVECLSNGLRDLRAHTANALGAMVPFLNPDQLQKLAAAMREGRSTCATALDSIDPRLLACLSANVVDEKLRPYYECLLSQSRDSPYIGFKLIRPEGQPQEQARAGAEVEGVEAVDQSSLASEWQGQTLFWFFFPLAQQNDRKPLVAWEATSASRRASYFFRLEDAAGSDELQDGIEKITKALGILNFRRRPIYLSDTELQSNSAWQRYAIARRRIPELQQLRINFVGRAVHTSVDQWKSQVSEILKKV